MKLSCLFEVWNPRVVRSGVRVLNGGRAATIAFNIRKAVVQFPDRLGQVIRWCAEGLGEEDGVDVRLYKLLLDLVVSWRKSGKGVDDLYSLIVGTLVRPWPAFVPDPETHEFFFDEYYDNFLRMVGEVRSSDIDGRVQRALVDLGLTENRFRWAVLNPGNMDARNILDAVARIVLGRGLPNSRSHHFEPHIVHTGQTRKPGSHKSMA